MAKKTRTKGKDDDKPTKGGGNKPVKVVTFDTPKKGSSEQQQPSDDWEVDNASAVSGSAAWGETAGDGDWGQSSAVGWSSPTPQSLPVPPPVPPEAHSPIPSSPRPPQPRSASPDLLTTKVSDKAMLEDPHDDFQNWEHHPDSSPDHSWGSPLSNASTHIAPTSPLSQTHSSLFVDRQSLTFTAAGAAMQNPKPKPQIQVQTQPQPQKYTSASEQARKNLRTPAVPQYAPNPPPPAASKPPEHAPPPTTNAKPKPTQTAQQWTTWTKGTPTSPQASNHRFGSRDDYAVVAAALERDIRKAAAAAGHHPPQAGWPTPSHSGGWADPPKASSSSQQGKRVSAGWPQVDTGGWSIPKNSDAGWDTKSKRKSGTGSGWANGSETGWSQTGRPGHHQPHIHTNHVNGHKSNHHKPMNQSWQGWGGGQVEETDSDTEDEDDEWKDQEDWYANAPSKGDGWGAQGGGEWGDKVGDEWGGKVGGWDDKHGGARRHKGGGWDDKLAAGSWNDKLKGGDWDNKLKGGGWDDKTKGGGWDDRLNSSGWDDRLNSSGWDDKLKGSSWDTKPKGGGWDDKLRKGGLDNKLKRGGWDNKPKGGGWGDKPGESSKSKDNSGWNTSGADPWTMNTKGWDNQEASNWGVNQDTRSGFKVITDPPENPGTREALSPLQRSQILNSLLRHEQEHKASGSSSRYPHAVTLTDNPVPHKSHKLESSWGQQDGWGPIQEEEEEDEDEDESSLGYEQPQISLQKHDPWSNKMDDTTYSMPSKTLAYAYKDTTTSLHHGQPRNSMNDYTSIGFVESQGRALKPVEQALFGKARWAKDRIYWMFPSDKDERVSQLLSWIEQTSYQLGTFGVCAGNTEHADRANVIFDLQLHKFLQSRERGALVVNAGFRLPELPNQPVFDWLTFDQLQATMDKTLQESVVFYDPAMQVIVFILLPSKSGNSVAMWRRKVKVPNNTRLMYQQHITQAVAGLKKELDYTVYVDRLPLKPEDPDKPKPAVLSKLSPTKASKLSKDAPLSQKKKRKWWQIFK